jgi:hypothetical protein
VYPLVIISAIFFLKYAGAQSIFVLEHEGNKVADTRKLKASQ